MTKLKLKFGEIECEYEGPEEFLRKDLLSLLQEVAKFSPPEPFKKGHDHSKSHGTGQTGSPVSVSTLAQSLSVSSGPDLIVAAALSFARAGSQSFTKKQLRERIRDAQAFYKSSYASNFDNYVARLVKNGRLSHTGGDNYALPAKELATLESKLNSSGA